MTNGELYDHILNEIKENTDSCSIHNEKARLTEQHGNIQVNTCCKEYKEIIEKKIHLIDYNYRNNRL